MSSILESDWKIFRELQRVALERFCQRTCERAATIGCGSGTAHERYLELYRFVNAADKELADAFDDLRRSTARFQILIIHSMNLWTEEEIQRFSPELQEHLAEISAARRKRTPTS